jgi:hypothetical protein
LEPLNSTGKTNKENVPKFRLDQSQIDSIEKAKEKLVTDIDLIYSRSYNKLQKVFKGEFQESNSFKNMMLLMNQNMVEF